MKNSLYLKISLLIILFILAMMSLVSVWLARAQSEYYREQLRRSGRIYLEQFINSVHTALSTGDDILLLNAVQAAYNPSGGVRSIYLLDSQKNIIAHHDASRLHTKYEGDFADPLLLSREIKFSELGLYYAVLELEPQLIRAAEAEIHTQIARVAIVVLFIGLLGSGVLAGYLVKPIKLLKRSVRKIADGDYGFQVDISRSDEIGELGESINWMSGRIYKDREELVEKQRMESELNVGKEIQQRLLPNSLPEAGDYGMSVVYRSSRQVGGDMYDVVPVDDNKYAIFVADASGKGVPGALLMTNTLSSLRALFEENESDDFKDDRQKLVFGLRRLNSLLLKHTSNCNFVSLFAGLLDTGKHNLIFARCGHNPLVFYSSKQNKHTIINSAGAAVGVLPSEPFVKQLELKEMKLQPGDGFYQYSDGITELSIGNNERLSLDGFVDCLENIDYDRFNTEKILKEVVSYSEEDSSLDAIEFEDDVVLLTVNRNL